MFTGVKFRPHKFLLLLFLVSGIAYSDVINVPADFSTIQAAIDDISTLDGDEIVVASGTYFEAINFNGKAITLRSDSGNPNDAIIDGTGNFHVIQCVSGEVADTVLDGFTIIGGDANSLSPPNDRGGGMFINNSSPTIVDCNFIGNSGIVGGGVANQNSSPTITDCTFNGNSADSGAGIYNFNGSNPSITDCNFINNTTNIFGGAMYNQKDSLPVITNCAFISNQSSIHGGGILNHSDSYPTITGCIFIDNQAGYDGGGLLNTNASALMTNCSFIGNSAERDGGGIFNLGSSVLDPSTLINCGFSGNYSDRNGGGIHIDAGSPVIINCSFSNNTAMTDGGGIHNESSNSTISNTIFWNNSDNGGQDESAQIHTVSGTPVVTFSDVQGGWTGSGTGNINVDPLFIDPDGPDTIIGTNDDNLRLQAGSPAIDAGDSTTLPVDVLTDLDGNPRVLDEPNIVDTGLSIIVVTGDTVTIDMGVYEFQPDIPCKSLIDGDINCDGKVDLLDLSLLAGNWLYGTGP